MIASSQYGFSCHLDHRAGCTTRRVISCGIIGRMRLSPTPEPARHGRGHVQATMTARVAEVVVPVRAMDRRTTLSEIRRERHTWQVIKIAALPADHARGRAFEQSVVRAR